MQILMDFDTYYDLAFLHKTSKEVTTDGLNTEEVYGSCLLGKKNFSLLLMRAPKLPRKSLFLFSVCGDIK